MTFEFGFVFAKLWSLAYRQIFIKWCSISTACIQEAGSKVSAVRINSAMPKSKENLRQVQVFDISSLDLGSSDVAETSEQGSTSKSGQKSTKRHRTIKTRFSPMSSQRLSRPESDAATQGAQMSLDTLRSALSSFVNTSMFCNLRKITTVAKWL